MRLNAKDHDKTVYCHAEDVDDIVRLYAGIITRAYVLKRTVRHGMVEMCIVVLKVVI